MRGTIIFADRLKLQTNDGKTLMFCITDGDDTASSRKRLAEARKIFKKHEGVQQSNMANAAMAYFTGSG